MFEHDLSNDILINNNDIPNGVWEDSDAGILYPDLQDLDEYSPYSQPCKCFTTISIQGFYAQIDF